MTPPKRKPGFALPAFGTRHDQERKALLSAMVTSMASDERVIENTPSLRKLQEILARPIP